MKQKFILEIAVESIAAAQAAERGGADRIELCADLRRGGLTPSAEMMREARATLKIPIHAMIRPRAGDFCYSDEEFSAMKESIDLAQRMKMDGVVLGALRDDHSIDVERSEELVQQARPMKVTFHRAFDECKDLLRGMEDVIRTGADRILTSGGAPDAVLGRDTLRMLVLMAGKRIVIMPGAGITPDNFAAVALAIGASEYHSGLGKVLRYGSKDFSRFEEEVRKLARAKNGEVGGGIG
jgi:copper homeostasis protein